MNEIKNYHVKKNLLATFVVIILFLILFSYPVIKVKWHQSNPIQFNKNEWLSSEISNNNTSYLRLKMASYLISNNELLNKTEQQITSMLGKPQNHSSITGPVYWLSPLGLDSMWLQITYKNGVVSNAQIISD